MYGGELQVDRSVVIDLLLSGIYLGLTFVAQSAGRFIEESCIRFVFADINQLWKRLSLKTGLKSLGRLDCFYYWAVSIVKTADLYFSLSQFVNEQNWFHLFSVSKKHSLSRLKSEIRRFVGANLTPVSDQISFKVNPFLRNCILFGL